MRLAGSLALAAALLAASVPARAQVQGRFPPDSLTNLKYFPRTIAFRDLLDTMKLFTRALGVRCTYCHLGDEGRPLASYDFASDLKGSKRKAREMLRMVRAINDQYLANLEVRLDPPVRVQCVTCHRGVDAPRQLQEALGQAYGHGGVDSTVALYLALRQRYFGRSAYDFGEVPLADVAGDLAARGKLADAVRLYALNVAQNPQSAFARRQHAEAAVQLAFSASGADSGVATYRSLQASYGPAALPEETLNDVGYALLGAGKPAEAVAALQLNVEAFPQSANGYDSLGEALAAAGDTARAITSYERSLALDPHNANAVRKLQELRGRGGH